MPCQWTKNLGFIVTDALVASRRYQSSRLAAQWGKKSDDAEITDEGSLDMPGTEAIWQLRCTRHAASSPSALVLHRAGRDRGWWAREGHTGVGVDDRNDFPCAHCSRLLETHLIKITVHRRRHIGVGRSGRQRDGWGDLLGGLDLMLQWGRIRRSARQ